MVGPSQLAQEDIGLVQKPLEHQLSLPITTKQQWIESIQAALHWKSLHEYGNIAM